MMLATMLTACTQLPTYRYRLTVEVDTPEGLRQGSSVIRVKTQDIIGFPGPDAGGIRTSVKGEAVVVDLGRRGLLFALLRNANEIAVPSLRPVRGDKSRAGETAGDSLRAVKRVAGRADVPEESRPILVRFRDIDDPKSVEIVDADDLASAFGPGVRLRRITAEITNDRMTEKLEDILPWLGTTQLLNGQSFWKGSKIIDSLDTGDFKED